MTTVQGLQLPELRRPRCMDNIRRWSEAELVAGCRAGQREALDALVSAYQDRLLRLATALAGPGAAADLVQETLLAAVRSFPRFRGESQLSTWLISILRNQFSLYLRGRKKWQLAPLPEKGDCLPAPEPSTVDDEVRELLDRVKDLPEDLRTTLILFHVDGLKYADIARVMECPIGTVRSRLFEARERLKKLVTRTETP
jgi:RNA polymerase sigma-70 factor (ECF subfamily)